MKASVRLLAALVAVGVGACASTPAPANAPVPGVHLEEPPLTARTTIEASEPTASTEAYPNQTRPPRIPRLDRCLDLYPRKANANEATVIVAVDVAADGSVLTIEILSEEPSGQGFGASARSCLERQTYLPAHDVAGTPIPARLKLRIHSTR